MNFTTAAQYAVTAIVIAAVTVICALGKVDGTAAVAAIVGLGGIHVVGGIATPTTVTNNNPAPVIQMVKPTPPEA